MIPPYCFICNEYTTKYVIFAGSVMGPEGHTDKEKVCKEHYEVAKQYAHLDIKIATKKIREELKKTTGVDEIGNKEIKKLKAQIKKARAEIKEHEEEITELIEGIDYIKNKIKKIENLIKKIENLTN